MVFSIIIPVYNVESYLGECVNSIVSQNLKDIEIILIDDGSTDSSGVICDQLANRDCRVSVFHKKNGGLSEARNYGIEKANGDYCIFVDSDDWIKEDCLMKFSKLIEKNNRPDVIITRITQVVDGVKNERDCHFSEYLKTPMSKKRAIEWMLKYSDDTWPAVKLIVRRSFINDHHIRFAKGRLHEDEDCTRKICYHANYYIGDSNEWYFYRIGREASITQKISAKNIIDPIEMAVIHINYCNNNIVDMKRLIIERTMESVYNIVNRIDECSEADTIKVAECIENNREIFKIAPKRKYRVLFFAMRLFGIRRSLFILRKYNMLIKAER